MTRAATFKKADVDRAIAVVKAAGLRVAAVEIQRDGTIRVVTDDGRDLTKRMGASLNEWDYS